MSDPTFTPDQRELLLATAADSIEYGLHRGEPLTVFPKNFPEPFREDGACFVTLEKNRELRGCIGSTHAYRPLIVDVAENAFAASQRDPRFSPLSFEELEDVEVSLSILTPPEPLPFEDEADLLAKLVPGRDGLIIEDGRHHATFLPQVWDALPDPADFLHHLKRKAGLSSRPSPTLTAQRYRVIKIP